MQYFTIFMKNIKFFHDFFFEKMNIYQIFINFSERKKHRHYKNLLITLLTAWHTHSTLKSSAIFYCVVKLTFNELQYKTDSMQNRFTVYVFFHLNA